jgi:mannose-1-phosphate guanylyltransferase
MRAFLLAAGHGTRLRPLTNDIPKCLVKVAGKPMLQYWFDLFRRHGITEVLINLNHFPEQVHEYIEANVADINVNLIYEDILLGSLGTLIKNRSFVKDESEFLVFYSDNLTNVNITEMMNFHKSLDNPFTMGLFRANDPKSCGIAELNDNYTITNFEEKPSFPKSNLANAGVYIMKPELLEELNANKNELQDIGYELLPKLIGRMNGYEIEEFLLDMGTHANLKLANEFVINNPNLFSYVKY